jgi:hypothetical protein
MDVALATILCTSILNLVLAIRQSRCTSIESSCCCCDVSLQRDVLEDEHDP